MDQHSADHSAPLRVGASAGRFDESVPPSGVYMVPSPNAHDVLDSLGRRHSEISCWRQTIGSRSARRLAEAATSANTMGCASDLFLGIFRSVQLYIGRAGGIYDPTHAELGSLPFQRLAHVR